MPGSTTRPVPQRPPSGVAGKQALYDYCAREGVPHVRLGKLVVATCEDELPALERIHAQALANGVDDLVWLDRAEVRALEPELVAARAIFSPSSGIVDSHALMGALKRDAVAHGATIVTATPVRGGRVTEDGFELELGGAEPAAVRCKTLVNSAGLGAPALSLALTGLIHARVPRVRLVKGHYFVLRGRAPFRHLVYPVPVPGGLGVHVTLDLGGRVRFGPDVSVVDHASCAFDEARASTFYAAVRAYYPAPRRRQPRARLHGYPREPRPPGRHTRFPNRGAPRDRRSRLRRSLRYRVARSHRVTRHCGTRARTRLAFSAALRDLRTLEGRP
jgi:L-2-hydroxyglutarate oxidase LhgO